MRNSRKLNSIFTFSFPLSPSLTGGGDNRPSTPTATERVLPWKRQDDEGLVLKQNEFPAWASNKEYLAYNSPSATFLGNHSNSTNLSFSKRGRDDDDVRRLGMMDGCKSVWVEARVEGSVVHDIPGSESAVRRIRLVAIGNAVLGLNLELKWICPVNAGLQTF